MRTKIRLMIDISMTVLLPFLMAYSLIGEAFHEVVGTAIFVLFLLDYLTIMALFMIIGFLTVYALSRLRKTRKAVKR